MLVTLAGTTGLPSAVTAFHSPGHHLHSKSCKVHTWHRHIWPPFTAQDTTCVAKAAKCTHNTDTSVALQLSWLGATAPASHWASWAIPPAIPQHRWWLQRCVLNAPGSVTSARFNYSGWESSDLTPPCPSAGIYHPQVQLTAQSLSSPQPLRFTPWWITVNYKLITVKSPSAAAAEAHRDNEPASLISLPLLLMY